jgi:hypothetical protein
MSGQTWKEILAIVILLVAIEFLPEAAAALGLVAVAA